MRRGDLVGDRYELDQPIGRGGMGEVWRAYDRSLDRRLAVKFTLLRGTGPDDTTLKRFEQEARSTAWFEHPGVPTVYDFGRHQDGDHDLFYLVLQFVDGTTVDHVIDTQEQLPISWAALIAAQVCAVLSVAHERPLIHRDLKPSNLMLCRDGSIKVLDFGAAVGLAPGDVRSTTTWRGAPFTPGYAATEQMYGTPGPQSDLYSLGCVLYEMLTGRQVFQGATEWEVMRRHEDDPPAPPTAFRPDIPPGLNDLVLHLLAKRPQDRPAKAQDVYTRLLQFVSSLQPLPGMVDEAAPPVRLYADAVGRIQLTAAPAEPPAEPQQALPTSDQVRETRTRAAGLAHEGRFTQAAELLADMAEPASLALGEDEEALGLRIDLADALFHGGDFRRARHAYRKAAAELGEWYGPDDEKVLECREREALCLAQLGSTDTALDRLEALLRDIATSNPYDPFTFRVREEIARLRLAARQTDDARKALTALRDDLHTAYPDGHPQAERITTMLADLDI